MEQVLVHCIQVLVLDALVIGLLKYRLLRLPPARQLGYVPVQVQMTRMPVSCP